MSRTSIMTIGFLLIWMGIKLNMIESYVLSGSATRFWMERIEDPAVAVKSGYSQYGETNPYQSLFQQASFGGSNSGAPQKTLTPPQYLCWPTFFFGFVMLLHGAAQSKD